MVSSKDLTVLFIFLLYLLLSSNIHSAGLTSSNFSQEFEYSTSKKDHLAIHERLNSQQHFLFPDNESIIDYSPALIIVKVSNPGADLIEMKVNKSEWLPMTLNDDFFLLFDSSEVFWYYWLPVVDSGDYQVEFRENSSIIWNEKLHFISDLSSFPELELDSIQLDIDFSIVGEIMTSTFNNYHFNGQTRSFQFEKINHSISTGSTSITGYKTLNTVESNELINILDDIKLFIAGIGDTGLHEICCDEYIEKWNITLSAGEWTRTLTYNEHVHPPGFDRFIRFINEVTDSTPGITGSLPSWEFIIVIVAIFSLGLAVKFQRGR
ncbi:MAG: hypothetical protein ACXAEU_20875 [Candidatus Hodarchaeales archaeon]|jgi:hypothetical protein